MQIAPPVTRILKRGLSIAYAHLTSSLSYFEQVFGPLSVWHGDGYEKLFQKHGFYVRTGLMRSFARGIT